MMKNRIYWLLTRSKRIGVFVAIFFGLSSMVAFADVFGIGQAIQTGIANSIQSEMATIVGQAIDGAVKLLDYFVYSPTDLAAIPSFQAILYGIQTIATSLALMIFVKEQFVNANDPDGRSPSQIIVAFIKTSVLIYVLPLIVDFFVTINNDLCQMILHVDLGSAIKDNQVIQQMGTTISSSNFTVAMTSGREFGNIGLLFGDYIFVFLMVMIVLAVSMFFVAIYNGVRYIELLFLIAVGPFLAISKTAGGDLFEIWMREMLAVVFAEAVQLFSIHFGLLFLIDPQFSSLGGSSAVATVSIGIGGMIFAIRGPKTLRQLMYKGTSGGGGGLRAMGTIAMAVIPK